MTLNQQIGASFATSLAVHLLIALLVSLLLATSALHPSSTPAPEPQPEEITVPLSQLIRPEFIEEKKDPETYITTTPDQENAKPDAPRYISDRDTVAGSKAPPAKTGDPTMPAQVGIDIPVVEFHSRDFIDGELREEENPLNAKPQPVAQQSTPTSPTVQSRFREDIMDKPIEELPEPKPKQPDEIIAKKVETPKPVQEIQEDLPSPEKVAERPEMLFDPPEPEDAEKPTNTTPPPPKVVEQPVIKPAIPVQSAPSSVPVKPKHDDAFQAQTRPTTVRGTISNQRNASVDAANTPIGRYAKQATKAIEREWHRKRAMHGDFLTFGSIKLEFKVGQRGKVIGGVRITKKDANAVMTDFTIRAIEEAPIPPMPKDVIDILQARDQESLEIIYDVLVY